jgi:hypothetical protein
MIQQGILPFKLEHSDELIAPRSGLALFAEVIRALKAERRVRESFARPGSNRGYEAWEYIVPLLLMREGGRGHIEDLREIQDDGTLRPAWASADAVTLDFWGLASAARGERRGGGDSWGCGGGSGWRSRSIRWMSTRRSLKQRRKRRSGPTRSRGDINRFLTGPFMMNKI